MTYSCAFFADENDSLDASQKNRIDKIVSVGMYEHALPLQYQRAKEL